MTLPTRTICSAACGYDDDGDDDGGGGGQGHPLPTHAHMQHLSLLKHSSHRQPPTSPRLWAPQCGIVATVSWMLLFLNPSHSEQPLQMDAPTCWYSAAGPPLVLERS